MRALVITDQQLLSSLVELALHDGTCETRVVSRPEDTEKELREWQPHLALIDMEVGDGAIVGWLKRGTPKPTISIIALTRRDDLTTKLTAFELGVDDIMTVPFSPEELMARVKALVRRS